MQKEYVDLTNKVNSVCNRMFLDFTVKEVIEGYDLYHNGVEIHEKLWKVQDECFQEIEKYKKYVDSQIACV